MTFRHDDSATEREFRVGDLVRTELHVGKTVDKDVMLVVHGIVSEVPEARPYVVVDWTQDRRSSLSSFFAKAKLECVGHEFSGFRLSPYQYERDAPQGPPT